MSWSVYDHENEQTLVLKRCIQNAAEWNIMHACFIMSVNVKYEMNWCIKMCYAKYTLHDRLSQYL